MVNVEVIFGLTGGGVCEGIFAEGRWGRGEVGEVLGRMRGVD